jgi:hypothetical protein
MGQIDEKAVSGQTTPTGLDAQIRRGVTHDARFAKFVGTVENRFWKIKELHSACQQPVN